jgi:hypothetical protein
MEQREVSGEEFRQMSVSSRPKNKTKHTIHIPLVWLVIVVVVGAGCFFIGDHYGKDHVPKSTKASSASANSGFGGGFGGAERSLRAFGTVSAISSSSITVQNQRTSSSDTYNITSSTQITDNGQTVTYTDIQTGDTVVITKASSSSSDASAIDVNPSFGGFGGGSASPQSSSGN